MIVISFDVSFSIVSIDFLSSLLLVIWVSTSFFNSSTWDSISISTNGIPSLTISPTFIRIFFTTPSADAGISIAALSVSRIIIESSDSTF